MAKGNDGNLFQHLVEMEVASRLLRESQGLHLIATHAMGDTEPFGDGTPFDFADDGQLLRSRLRVAADVGRGHLLIEAYRATSASPAAYPNTAKLVRWLCDSRSRALTGDLIEFNSEKVIGLQAAWAASGVVVHEGRWQECVGQLAPVPPGSGWLMTMDPMTFLPATDRDDCLSERGLSLLRPALQCLLGSRAPGVFLAFVYSLRPDMQRAFTGAFEQFAVALSTNCSFLALSKQRTNAPARHVVAMLASDGALLADIRAGLIAGRQLPFVEPYRNSSHG